MTVAAVAMLIVVLLVMIVVAVVLVLIVTVIVMGEWLLRRAQELFALFKDLKRDSERLKVLQKSRRHSQAAHNAS